MPDILRVEVVGPNRPLTPPTAVLDPATSVVVEAASAAARRDAYREGELAGRRAALADMEQVASRLADALRSATDEIRHQRATVVATGIELATLAATAVLDSTPPPESLAVLARVRSAVESLDDEAFEVRLHPQDHAVLANVAPDRRLRLVADEDVAVGDARIVGTFGGAELTRRALLDAALAALAADRR